MLVGLKLSDPWQSINHYHDIKSKVRIKWIWDTRLCEKDGFIGTIRQLCVLTAIIHKEINTNVSKD